MALKNTLVETDWSGKRPLGMSQKALSSIVNDIFAELKRRKLFKQNTNLAICWANPSKIRKLNAEFRGKDQPTDVLSFGSIMPNYLGELVLCENVLRKNARQNGFRFQLEVTYILIHGVLHLLGMDHEKSDTEARAMYRLQDSIFEKLTGIQLTGD